MRPWRDIGIVDTIYEEDYENSSTSSPSFSSPSSLRSRVDAWVLASGRKTDVLIHVQGTSFHLHRDPLSSRSIYLRRQLTDHSQLTLSPPLNITPETFSLVADFCYGNHVLITPFNVAALRIAAELLQMTEPTSDGCDNLKHMTEAYFRRVVAVNGDYASTVFRSCLALLPEAETTALMVSRCVEALRSAEDGRRVDQFFDEDVLSLPPEDFKIVADSMHQQFSRHDVLYRMVDFYLEDRDGKITEEQKTLICNSIDCDNLSAEALLHAVQNPRMPLRFIVRAMLVEQLKTRRSIFSSASKHHSGGGHRPATSRDPITLGAILQRDAARSETAQLKAAMEAASSRIEDLERQLDGMKKLLEDSENTLENGSKSVLECGRSVSFHYGSSGNSNLEKGDRGSVSSASFRFSLPEERETVGWSSSLETAKMKKNLGQRLIEGLKSRLWVSNSAPKRGSDKSKVRDGAIFDCKERRLVWSKDEPSPL